MRAKRIGIGVIIFAFVAILSVGSFIVFVHYLKLPGKIYPNVYLDNIDVGEKTREEVLKKYDGVNNLLHNKTFVIVYKGQATATISAETLNVRSDIVDAVERAYLIGRSNHFPSRILQNFLAILRLNKFSFQTSIIYDKAPLDDILTNLEESYNKKPKDALFAFEENRVTAFEPEENGLVLETNKLKNDLAIAVKNLNNSSPAEIQLILTDRVLAPETTLAKANSMGIEELIGEGKSDYSHSIPERIYNVILAANKFNGVIIPQGEEFSFASVIGDISAATGFKQAYVIQAGRTVLGDGGGVCQVSTTLFRAALATGLPITQWHAHAYRVGYYENDSPPGLDATVFVPSVDLRFKNDTPAAILIKLELDKENHLLSYKFYGKKDGRQIERTEPKVSNYLPAPPEIRQDDPTLPNGVVKQVDWSAAGATATFDYKVTKDGQVSFEKKFRSVYKPWAAVYLVGTGG